MSSGGQDQPAAGDEIVVPCLGNEDIDALAAHLRDKRFFWLDLHDPSTPSSAGSASCFTCIR